MFHGIGRFDAEELAVECPAHHTIVDRRAEQAKLAVVRQAPQFRKLSIFGIQSPPSYQSDLINIGAVFQQDVIALGFNKLTVATDVGFVGSVPGETDILAKQRYLQ